MRRQRIDLQEQYYAAEKRYLNIRKNHWGWLGTGIIGLAGGTTAWFLAENAYTDYTSASDSRSARTCSTCRDYNNPLDPDAEDYQGFLTLDDPAELELHSPADGYSGYFLPEFLWSEITGVQEYRLQIASDADFSTDHIV